MDIKGNMLGLVKSYSQLLPSDGVHPGGLWTQPRNQGGAPERRRTGVAPTKSPASVASPELDVPPKARPTSSLHGRPPGRQGLACDPETNPLLSGGT